MQCQRLIQDKEKPRINYLLICIVILFWLFAPLSQLYTVNYFVTGMFISMRQQNKEGARVLVVR